MPSLRLERPRFPRPLRVHPQAEPLEGRSLLSHVLPRSIPQTLAIHAIHVSPRSAPQKLAIQVPSAFIGPGTSEVNVTLSRSSPAGSAGLTKRLTVWFSDNYVAIPAVPTNRSLEGHPGISKNVTFQPGQASLTIPVPVPAVPAGYVSVDVVLAVQRPFMSLVNFPTTTNFTVFASADKVPPTIVATKLTPQGLALTFSKPMDSNTVQDIHNYDVNTLPGPVNMGGNWSLPPEEHLALQAAVYDPTTQIVTLIPTKPLDLADTYAVGSIIKKAQYHDPHSPVTQALTDLEGNPIEDSFQYNSLSSNPGSFWKIVGPHLSTGVLGSPA